MRKVIPTPTQRAPRNRHNISISETARQRGEAIAALDKRSFSNLLEVLIDKEYERRTAASASPDGVTSCQIPVGQLAS